MDVQNLVTNKLVKNRSDVWMLEQHTDFAYSDGADSEKYLEKVFRKATDLSSGSPELESYIKDWPSEYHLTSKRVQLFDGFEFDRKLKALEVGCGCGAITRYLGENFDNVVSIEGSPNRARLARLRTRGLDTVSVLCAPFQEIQFSQKFDIIFCIGVYEYSASFVESDEPYDAVLEYFREILNPDGVVVIAIENQFGLKYFNGVREDHTGVSFDGIQGYAFENKSVKTFGKVELERKLAQYFSTSKMFFPFPDYKLPSSIISEEFLSTELCGELVSQIRSRDYKKDLPRLWDDSLAKLELSKNGMLPFFADSLLVFATNSDSFSVRFDQLAIIASSERHAWFRTYSRIHESGDGNLYITKRLRSGDASASRGKLTLNQTTSKWQDCYSLETIVHRNGLSGNQSLSEMFSPCTKWIEFLKANAIADNGREMVDGEYIDCILSNVFPCDNGVSIVDREWVWSEPVPLNVLVVRALFVFLNSIEHVPYIGKPLRRHSLRSLIASICNGLGIDLESRDFEEFIALESEFQCLVGNASRDKTIFVLRWTLRYRPILRVGRGIMRFGKKVIRRIHATLENIRS